MIFTPFKNKSLFFSRKNYFKPMTKQNVIFKDLFPSLMA
jgi:hypothetical protein